MAVVNIIADIEAKVKGRYVALLLRFATALKIIFGETFIYIPVSRELLISHLTGDNKVHNLTMTFVGVQSYNALSIVKIIAQNISNDELAVLKAQFEAAASARDKSILNMKDGSK